MAILQSGQQVNKWCLNRAGVVNFWYYDEEEFAFAGGRLLLRGSNGSGKSVTMQSLITVLLDGVKSPDRLDSFGSRSRRMEDYLLGEKGLVNRDERTGYLYLEYKRQNTNQYLTTGIGLQARRSGNLDFWGFIITDNRRIRHDFWLYKCELNPLDGGTQKVPLTRAELEKAIGAGGQVVRSQKDYAELVNRHIFGFETAEQYEELMKLLIQLRSPKLSKDFKPSVIYEILNASLPSLSDEELRPLSDTIESMERTKLQIEQLERDRQALNRLCRQYDLYNSYILAEKADLAQKCERRRTRLERENTELAARLAGYREELAAEQLKQTELERELAVLQTEKQQLEQHDAFQAEQQKQRQEGQLAQLENQHREKQAQLAEKQRREREEAARLRGLEEKAELCRQQSDELIGALTDNAAQAAFAGHSLFADALAKNSAEFSFSAWRVAASSHRQTLAAVLTLLRRQAEGRARQEQIEKELGEERRLLDELRAEARRLEQQFSDCRQQLLADAYSWQEKYQTTLPLDQEELRQLALSIQGLYDSRAWSDVTAPIEAAYGRQVQALNQDMGLINAKIKNVEEQEAQLAAQLAMWRNQRDPEPERSSDVQAARALLADKGIPFLPLYAAVEFREQVEPAVRERIEAALTDMGLLDALIVPRDRHKDIPAGEVYGAVIKPNPQIMAVTLADYLYPAPAADGQITSADIDEVLRSILVEDLWSERSHHESALTVVAVDSGAYRTGLVSGRAARRPTAVYIGRQARQEYRRQQIAKLEAQLAELALTLEELYGKLATLKQQLQAAGEAKENFLTEDAIRALHHEKLAVALNITRQEQRVNTVDERLRTVVSELKALLGQIQAASAGIELPLAESEYQQALATIQDYQASLHELELCRRDYANYLASARQCRERLTEIQQDVDTLKGETFILAEQIAKIKLEIANIEQRLQAMGADALRERMRQVAKRLSELPAEKDAALRAVTTLEANIRVEEGRCKQLAAKLKFMTTLSKLWQQVVQDEQRLGLVYPDDQPRPTIAGILQDKGDLLKKDRLDRTEVIRRLSDSFYAENNILMEYRMQLEPLVTDFTDLPAIPADSDDDGEMASELDKLREKSQRLIITLNYEGRRQNPYQLQLAINDQIALQRTILSDKDKELYEEVIMNNIGRIISRRIRAAQQWVEDMNKLMLSRDNSNGLKFKLEWKAKAAEQEDELDTYDLVKLLHADPAILKEEDLNKIVRHFQARIERAKRASEGATDGSGMAAFQQTVREVLDYRAWFQFKLSYEKTGLTWRELTDRQFFTFSGGEKALAMYIPLFSAVFSRYQEARPDAPYIITLDEAFAGVDENNIREMFALVEQLGFNYIMNSQALWGDYDVVPALAIYELVRPKNAPYVTVIGYHWNGYTRSLAVDIDEAVNQVAAATALRD